MASLEITLDTADVAAFCDEARALLRDGAGLPRALAEHPDEAAIKESIRITATPVLAVVIEGPLLAWLTEIRAIRAAEGCDDV